MKHDWNEVFPAGRPLLLIGCGRMGGALARAWLSDGLKPQALIVVDPVGSPPAGVTCLRDITEIDGSVSPRAVVLAVKPQLASGALDALAPFIPVDCLLLSIAAGIPLARLGAAAPRAVRAMPNTPAAIGKGISALIASANLPKADQALADRLLRAAGKTVWLDDEAQMDAVTALSGSGPAYVFALVEAMAKAGEAEGLPAAVADVLARETVAGAAALLGHDPRPASQLRTEVTSPNGTTEAALRLLLCDGGLDDLIGAAIAAAARRSRELSSS